MKHLKSDFSFGFELEGLLEDHKRLSTLKNKLDKFFDNEGSMDTDGSIRQTKACSGRPFEYASPVIKYSPTNLSIFLNFLDNLPEFGVKVNNSCGFHTHISFTGISRDDAVWFILWLSGTEKYKELLFFNDIKFYSPRYASIKFFEKIHDALANHDIVSALKQAVSNEKYRVIRIHPQGTLEWRGPRKFLNKVDHLANVNYLKMLDKYMNLLNESLDTNFLDVCNVPYFKKDIINDEIYNVRCGFDFRSNKEKKDLYDIIDKNPEILDKMAYKDLVKNKDTIIRLFNWSFEVMNTQYKSKALAKFMIENNFDGVTLANRINRATLQDYMNMVRNIYRDREIRREWNDINNGMYRVYIPVNYL